MDRIITAIICGVIAWLGVCGLVYVSRLAFIALMRPRGLPSKCDPGEANLSMDAIEKTPEVVELWKAEPSPKKEFDIPEPPATSGRISYFIGKKGSRFLKYIGPHFGEACTAYRDGIKYDRKAGTKLVAVTRVNAGSHRVELVCVYNQESPEWTLWRKIDDTIYASPRSNTRK